MRPRVKVVVVGSPTSEQLGEIQGFHRRWWNRVEITTSGIEPSVSHKGSVWWLGAPPASPQSQSGNLHVLDMDSCIWAWYRRHKRWFCVKWSKLPAEVLGDVMVERIALFNGDDPNELAALVQLARLTRLLGKIAV